MNSLTPENNPQLIEYRRLAGKCVKCVNYNWTEARFTNECYMCKRYWGDLFESKNEKEKK